MDVILDGGWVVDGTGCPPFRADVGVTGDRVAALGNLQSAEAARRIDCSDLYVMPGFIDAHVHGESAVFDEDMQVAALAQGVTTLIVGQDGVSFAPTDRDTMRYVCRYFGAINGTLPGVRAGCSVDGLLSMYDGTTPLNVGYLIPRGNVRLKILGTAGRPPTDEELARMRDIVSVGMEQGALGLSTGLDYIPDRYGDSAEISSLAAESRRYGGIYVTHMRGYEATCHLGVAEAAEIAQSADVAVHVSHYHGPANMLIGLVDDARARGIDITYDSYPYARGSSIVAMVALPAWAQSGTMDETIERLGDPRFRRRLDREWFAERSDLFDRITFSCVGNEGFSWCEGKTVTQAAAQAGSRPQELLCDLLVASDLGVSCVFQQPPTNTELDRRSLMRHPAHMASSDAVYAGTFPHPRGWGAFARVLGRHTRDLGDYTWGEASVHLAGHAARRFRLVDRGMVRPGAYADIAVIDPRRVADRASYERPRQPARGVSHVLVGGVEVFRDGSLTGSTPGRALRGSGSRQ